MFERLTDKARRALSLAFEVSTEFRHGYIGTEHLLAGMLGHNGHANHVLSPLGLDREWAVLEIEKIYGRGTAGPSGHVLFTPRLAEAL